MPGKSQNKNSFNLIRKEVTFGRKLSSERNWYSSFNFLVILAITALAGLSYAFTLFNNSRLENKKIEVASYANRNVFTEDKKEIEETTNILNDKFSLYEKVKDQSFDFNKFNEDLLQVYPGLKINRVNYRPSTEEIEVQVSITVNADEGLSQVLPLLYNKFEGVKVSTINFENASADSDNAVTTESTSVTMGLEFPRDRNLSVLSLQ